MITGFYSHITKNVIVNGLNNGNRPAITVKIINTKKN